MNKIKTVLLIDDDEPTNFIHKKIMQGSGLVDAIHVVHGGREALHFLSHKDNKARDFPIPDLIFLDINMPAMDGWEFLAHYKQLKNIPTEEIVIVMLTTSLNPDDEVKARDMQEVDGYKSKPLTMQVIEEIVKTYF